MGKSKKKAAKKAKEQQERLLREQQEQMNRQAVESARANQFKDNALAAEQEEADGNQSGLGTTMLTSAEGITLADNQKKRKSLLGG